MKISLGKISLILFEISYFIFLSFSILGHIPIIGGYLKALTNFGIGIILISILLQIKTYKKKEIMILLLLLIFSLVLAYFCNDFILFKIVLLIAALKNVKLEHCITIDLYMRIILILSVLILYLLNVAPDVTSFYNGVIRHSLGFTNPNNLGMHILILSFDIICLNNFKISKTKYIIIIFLLIFSDYFTCSRSTTYILILVLILIAVYKKYPKFLKNKKISFFIKNSALIFSIITFIMYALYISNLPLGNALNNLLSNRLHNIHAYNQAYNITLFGNNNLNINLTLDTVYAYCIYIYGIAFFILFIIAFRKLFKKLYEQKKYILIIIMLCFMAYGLSEKLWLSIDYNIFIILFSMLIYDTKNKELQNQKE